MAKIKPLEKTQQYFKDVFSVIHQRLLVLLYYIFLTCNFNFSLTLL